METALKYRNLIELFNQSLAAVTDLDKLCVEILRADRHETLTFGQLRRASDLRDVAAASGLSGATRWRSSVRTGRIRRRPVNRSGRDHPDRSGAGPGVMGTYGRRSVAVMAGDYERSAAGRPSLQAPSPCLLMTDEPLGAQDSAGPQRTSGDPR
jgi:hypothetical protein